MAKKLHDGLITTANGILYLCYQVFNAVFALENMEGKWKVYGTIQNIFSTRARVTG